MFEKLDEVRPEGRFGRVFADSHHSALARSLFYLFSDRIGARLSFPSEKLVEDVNARHGEMWGFVHPTRFPHEMGGIELEAWERVSWCGKEEFLDTHWDAVVVSRSESQAPVKELLERHPRRQSIPVVAYAGNQREEFDWGFVKALMSSDWATYYMAPVPKIWVAQELGRHFFGEFVEIDEESLGTVGCFVNCFSQFGERQIEPDRVLVPSSDEHFRCPHCRGRMWPHGEDLPNVSPFGVVAGAMELLREKVKFLVCGHGNRDVGGACVKDVHLPKEYASSSVVVHFKDREGFGHSVLQAVACGRPVVCPRGFFRYKTAGRYLIPEVTCWEADWTAESVAEVVEELVSDIEEARARARTCRRAAETLFDWSGEARRVAKWASRVL